VNPSITHQELGLTLAFNITIAAGDYLLVDSNARTVLLNGTASRYSTLVQPNWFDLSPLTSNTIRFNGASGAGTMTFSYRNAWW
jgi:phage-related protein